MSGHGVNALLDLAVAESHGGIIGRAWGEGKDVASPVIVHEAFWPTSEPVGRDIVVLGIHFIREGPVGPFPCRGELSLPRKLREETGGSFCPPTERA